MKRKLEEHEYSKRVKPLLLEHIPTIAKECIEEICKILEPRPFLYTYKQEKATFYTLTDDKLKEDTSFDTKHLPAPHATNIDVESIPERGWFVYTVPVHKHAWENGLLAVYKGKEVHIQDPPELGSSQTTSLYWDSETESLIYSSLFKRNRIYMWNLEKEQLDHTLYNEKSDVKISSILLMNNSILAVATEDKKTYKIDGWCLRTKELLWSHPLVSEGWLTQIKVIEYDSPLLGVRECGTNNSTKFHLYHPTTGDCLKRDWLSSEKWHTLQYVSNSMLISNNKTVHETLSVKSFDVKDKSAWDLPICGLDMFKAFGVNHVWCRHFHPYKHYLLNIKTRSLENYSEFTHGCQYGVGYF